PWGNASATNITDSSAAITLQVTATPSSDTLAVLYYQTLEGETFSPAVSLQTASTENTCDTVMASGSATLTLLPPGCELGTLVAQPYATSFIGIFPNPVNGTATVQYSTGENAYVSLTLCDELGRTVQTIINSLHKPGLYSISFDTYKLWNGIYFLTMKEGEYFGVKEMFQLK